MRGRAATRASPPPPPTTPPRRPLAPSAQQVCLAGAAAPPAHARLGPPPPDPPPHPRTPLHTPGTRCPVAVSSRGSCSPSSCNPMPSWVQSREEGSARRASPTLTAVPARNSEGGAWRPQRQVYAARMRCRPHPPAHKLPRPAPSHGTGPGTAAGNKEAGTRKGGTCRRFSCSVAHQMRQSAPVMMLAPRSTGAPRPGSECECTRPPTRPRASSTTTSTPWRCR